MSEDNGRPVPPHSTPTAHCFYCGKSEDEVAEMYASDGGYLICGECVSKAKASPKETNDG